MGSFFLVLLATAVGAVPAPDREASWIPVGPPGGNVRALAADPLAPRRIYLGTPDGILYRSDDRGRHWQRLQPGFPRRDCSLDEIAVNGLGVVYVGFWEVHGKGGGIARSNDSGETFTLLKGMQGESVRALAIAPSNHRLIAAGSLSGAFLSRDGGDTWSRITPAGDPHLRTIESLAFDPVDPKIIFAGTRHLAWKTLDGGATWQPVHSGMIEDSHVMTLSVERRDRQGVYATACTGIYHSTSGGLNWTKLGGIPDSSRRTRSFYQSPDDPDMLLAGTTEGLWISEDRGQTWRLSAPKQMVINSLLLQDDGDILLGTEEEGVLRSSDRGQTWIPSNAGFMERFVSKVLFDKAGGRVLVAVRGARPNGGVFVASEVRGLWRRLGEGLDGREVLSLGLLGEVIYAGTDDGIFVRKPEPNVWTRLSTRVRGKELHPRVTELLVLPRGRVLAATSKGMLVSSDAGMSWKHAALGETGEVFALATSPSDPEVIVAATRSGFFRSADAGDSWTQVSNQVENMTPHALAFVPSETPVLLTTTSSGLFRSHDKGVTWHPVSGIPRSDLTGLAIHPDGRTVFASDFTRGGIFRSIDGGSKWERMTTKGLASDRVWALGLDPRNPEHLLAASPAGALHLLAPPSSAGDPAIVHRPCRRVNAQLTWFVSATTTSAWILASTRETRELFALRLAMPGI